jgi:hypothetical protein
MCAEGSAGLAGRGHSISPSVPGTEQLFQWAPIRCTFVICVAFLFEEKFAVIDGSTEQQHTLQP